MRTAFVRAVAVGSILAGLSLTTACDETSRSPPTTLVGEGPRLEGYGTTSRFGEDGEICTVSTLQDSGPGSLRDCVENRDTTDNQPTPRRIVFSVGGTIVPQTNIRVRQPFLTIDGLSAPEPGITIEKIGDGTRGQFRVTTWPDNDTCAHHLLIQGIRFRGVWTGMSETHSNNAGTISIDGEDLPRCLRHVVLNRITVIHAQDSGGDIWGSVADLTIQYSAFLRSLHPMTISHSSGGPDQQRERLSIHHNVFAYIHERGPQVRADVRDANFEQNIMHRWDAYGFGGGYAMRLRCRGDAPWCPDRVNVLDNHFTSGGTRLEWALVLGDEVGTERDDDRIIAPRVFAAGNRLPRENVDTTTAPREFPRAAEAVVTRVAPSDVAMLVLPQVGVPFRTTEETLIFDEVAGQIGIDLAASLATP